MNIKKKRLIIIGVVVAWGILFPILSFLLGIELSYMQPPKEGLSFPFTYIFESAIIFSIIALYALNLMSRLTSNHYILGSCFLITQIAVYYLLGWLMAHLIIREKKNGELPPPDF